MLTYCAYQGCTSKNIPCSSITFFTLPKDQRRQIWIENSGNVQLRGIGPKSVRYFCEKHFDPIFLKRQFTRTILHKSAVPYKYDEDESSKHVTSATSFNLEVAYDEQRLEDKLRENAEEIDSIESIEVFQESSYPDPGEPQEVKYEDEEYSNVEYVSAEESYEKEPDYDGEQAQKLDLECDTNTEECDEQLLIITEEKNSSRLKRTCNARSSETTSAKRKDTGATRKNPSVEDESFSNKASSSSDYVKENNISSNSLDYEEDKHFALSLVGYFKRLPMKKKAIAKLKILQYLTELEYDGPADL